MLRVANGFNDVERTQKGYVMKRTKSMREVEKAVCQKIAVQSLKWRQSKHLKLTVTAKDGTTAFTTVPVTASDNKRYLKNLTSDLLRTLRERGYEDNTNSGAG